MARAKKRGGREAEFRKVVKAQERSGLSVREFAEGEGITVQTLYWWRSELRRRDRARTQDSTDFVRVSVKSSPAGSSSECFAVQLPGGVLVRVPPRFEENELVRLLGVVRRSC